MDHFPYLFAAYGVVWSVLCLYLVSLGRRARKAEEDLEALKRAIEERRTSR